MKQIDVLEQQAILDGEVMRLHRMRQTFESDTRVRACAVRVAMDGAMEGAGG